MTIFPLTFEHVVQISFKLIKNHATEAGIESVLIKLIGVEVVERLIGNVRLNFELCFLCPFES